MGESSQRTNLLQQIWFGTLCLINGVWQLVRLQQLSTPKNSPVIHKIDILIEMTKIWLSELPIVFLEDRLVASKVASQIVLIERTNFDLYSIQIGLEMVEIWPKVLQLANRIGSKSSEVKQYKRNNSIKVAHLKQFN